MGDVPTREQLHAQVDAVPDGQLDDAQVVVAGSQNGATPENGATPQLGLSDTGRKRQQERLQEFADELRAEGADGSEYLPELEARAATWPE
jgi:hypothetical protein